MTRKGNSACGGSVNRSKALANSFAMLEMDDVSIHSEMGLSDDGEDFVALATSIGDAEHVNGFEVPNFLVPPVDIGRVKIPH